MRHKPSSGSRYMLAACCFAAALAVLFVRSSPTAADAKPHDPASLAVGKPAPEIQGADVDGKQFKLSDYRGKVVVLDFWGDW